MMNFKLVAVRPLNGCSQSILKNLKVNEFYFFDNSYKQNDEHNFVEKKSNITELPDNFFLSGQKNKIITYILGDMGNGLSSNRIDKVNIQAVVGKNGEGKSSLIELVLRILNNYFKYKKITEVVDNLIYAHGLNAELFYEVDGRVYKMSVNTCGNDSNEFKIDCIDSNNLSISDNNVKDLFFTMYINYSLYGLNEKDFQMENLDVNQKSWLSRIFHKNDGYQTQLVIHPYRKNGQIEAFNERLLLRERLISLLLNENTYRKLTNTLEVNSIKCKLKAECPLNTLLIDIVRNNKQVVEDSVKNDNEKSFDLFDNNINSQFYKYLNDNIVLDAESKSYSNDDIAKRKLFFNLSKNLNSDDIEKILKIGLIYSSLGRILVDGGNVGHSLLKDRLFNYCVYKCYKILTLYPKYSKYNKNIDNSIGEGDLNGYINDLHEYISRVTDDDSHISFKLNQAYTLLNFKKFYNDDELIKYYEELALSSFQEDKFICIDEEKLRGLIEKVMNKTKHRLEKTYLNPPRIFELDIDLKTSYSQANNISLDTLSSGEFQKIGVISSIIYHLKNLDSVKEEEMMFRYQNVSLILDEIELYFHPEYQRTFIKELLYRINNTQFNSLRCINILFVTHSPFILSDIPKQNVLFLEKGKPVFPMDDNTFGANIHTLLQNGFFLNSVPIGEFSKDKINHFFSILKEGRVLDSDKRDIYDQILLVSEPFLRSQLLKLYKELRSPLNIENLTDQIKIMQDEIKKLKNIIDKNATN